MIKVKELTEVQKNKLFGLEKCEGFWLGSKGFKHKRTIYTVDIVGAIWTHTNNRGAKYADWQNIRNLFK